MDRRLLALSLTLLVLPLALPGGGAQQPANCYATNVNAYREYSLQNVRIVWDQYSADSQGLCRWDKTMGMPMPQCRYGVQLGTPEFGQSGILCWWGSPQPTSLRTTLGGGDVARILNEVLARPDVAQALGPGTHTIVLEVGKGTTTVTVTNGVVTAVSGVLNPPAKCYETYMGGYREYNDPRVKATWDSYMADSLGVCRWDVPDRPLTDQCNHMVEYGSPTLGVPPFWLCWWGKVVSAQQSNVDVANPALRVTMSRDAWLSLVNTDDVDGTLLRLLEAKAVVLNFRDAAKQAGAKAALRALAGEAEPRSCPNAVGDVCIVDRIAYNRFGASLGWQLDDVRAVAGGPRSIVLSGSSISLDVPRGTGGLVVESPESLEARARHWRAVADELIRNTRVEGDDEPVLDTYLPVEELPTRSRLRGSAPDGDTLDTLRTSGAGAEWRLGAAIARAYRAPAGGASS